MKSTGVFPLDIFVQCLFCFAQLASTFTENTHIPAIIAVNLSVLALKYHSEKSIRDHFLKQQDSEEMLVFVR